MKFILCYGKIILYVLYKVLKLECGSGNYVEKDLEKKKVKSFIKV